jgi:release factor glutamine methyltransferase
MREVCPTRGRRVADLCTGSGVVAIAAATGGAESVLAVDVCPRAIRATRANAATAGAQIHTLRGSWARAAEFGPFDLILCNPPYVPEDDAPLEAALVDAGPPLAYNGGPTGRLVLDPLCASAFDLLDDGGRILIVQSEFADPDRTVSLLKKSGLQTRVAVTQTIDFGPVLHDRAVSLERRGLLRSGIRVEELLIIQAEKR